MAGHPDFEPLKVFEILNTDKSGSLDTAQLMEFLKKQYISPEPWAVEAMISEFDSEGRHSIDFDEFCQMILPAANSGLRDLAVRRRDSPYFRAHAPLPYEVISLVARLLDKELSFHRLRIESLQTIAKQEDFDRKKMFEQISRGFHSICMADLILFLEKNGFYPRREDIEAILRRLDHDANKMLSFEEFCEVCGPDADELSRDEDDDLKKFNEAATPLRKTQEDTTNNEKPGNKDKKTQELKTEETKKGSTEKQKQEKTAKKYIDSDEEKRREQSKEMAAQQRAIIE